MSRWLEVFNPKNIFFLLLIVIFIMWLGVGNIFNSLLHFFKPITFQVNGYEVSLKRHHWGYLKEDNRAHYLSGKDSIVSLEVLKNPNDTMIKDEFLQCYEVGSEKKVFQKVKGNFITCEAPMKFLVYFKSLDEKFLMRSELNEPLTKEYLDEYINFLTGVKKVEQ